MPQQSQTAQRRRQPYQPNAPQGLCCFVRHLMLWSYRPKSWLAPMLPHDIQHCHYSQSPQQTLWLDFFYEWRWVRLLNGFHRTTLRRQSQCRLRQFFRPVWHAQYRSYAHDLRAFFAILCVAKLPLPLALIALKEQCCSNCCVSHAILNICPKKPKQSP